MRGRGGSFGAEIRGIVKRHSGKSGMMTQEVHDAVTPVRPGPLGVSRFYRSAKDDLIFAIGCSNSSCGGVFSRNLNSRSGGSGRVRAVGDEAHQGTVVRR